MARTALFSSSTLSSAASGTRLPTLQVTLAFVAACGGDREEWRRRWMQVAEATDSEAARRQPHESPVLARELPRSAQLPLRPLGFVGRRDDLDRLRASTATPVVITGPVGVGKSGLALHYAHSIAAEMVDGQLFADLRQLTGTASDAEQVLDGFLRALRIPPHQLPATRDQRAGLFRSLLAERRLLVLLDNVRDERQVRPLLATSWRSVVLVVGRAPLLGLGDVHRVRLDRPPRADSIAMITAAVPERAAAEPQECDRLAELCEDLPLALDIAMRKLATRPEMPLCQVTARLTGRGALHWLSIGDISLRESLNSAYQELGEPARMLLMRIARRPVDQPEPAGDGTYELVEELIEAGLLRRGTAPDTYRVENLVREFAIETAVAPGTATTVRSAVRSDRGTFNRSAGSPVAAGRS